ncbi:nicotinamide-nucleotide adenylyltransferase [Spizellomyces punctatus DAOM BR117]|uniref:Nicotinamide-nucleotide adenylyltransferase n=1 Tax=Spizellomyces punctatus (strain DAOM BR117) TaxID=645134 RepID=A0A0L0HE72_SPIPD|nr:nicotinamide-nucleotide adenylyltransferase [Spizellomyces punctatus DAOM BR117]KNC99274.1 hypothetical protein SPPG_05529 [Spizellomyces punctatus DAOM BR117]|eukprot:XP_016607314.1 hypothetical protein SPPG_05529 [Spizellomyces punctatus DAOM BR117]
MPISTSSRQELNDFSQSFQESSLSDTPGVQLIPANYGWSKILSKIRKTRPAHVAILDSSFNPPTVAHAKLLENTMKLNLLNRYPKSATDLTSRHTNQGTEVSEHFDAYLLLFATKNADKALSGTSVTDRLLMMEALVQTVAPKCDVPDDRIGIAITTRGIFLDKAHALHSLLSSDGIAPVFLHFIMGYDTIIRFFDPKYYKNSNMDTDMEVFFRSSRIICADRVMEGASSESHDTLGDWLEEARKRSPIVGRFEAHIVTMQGWLEDPRGTAQASSTKARVMLKEFWKCKHAGQVEDATRIRAELRNLVPEQVMALIDQEGLYETL